MPDEKYIEEIQIKVDKAEADVKRLADALANLSSKTKVSELKEKFLEAKQAVAALRVEMEIMQRRAAMAFREMGEARSKISSGSTYDPNWTGGMGDAISGGMSAGSASMKEYEKLSNQRRAMLVADALAAKSTNSLTDAFSKLNNQYKLSGMRITEMRQADRQRDREAKEAAANRLREQEAAIKGAKRYSGVLDEWWQRFGKIAVNFTLVYRAMNAVGAGIAKFSDMIRRSIQDAGELTGLQAKMAMYQSLAAKGATNMTQSFKDASGSVMALYDASVTSVSSLQELTTALDEVSQAQVFPKPEQMQNFANFVDFTVLVAKSTGNTMTQIRSEVNALMTGQLRAGNVLIQAMLKADILTKEQIKNLRQMKDQAEVFNTVITKVGENWEKVKGLIVTGDPSLAFGIWEKGIMNVYTKIIMMLSKSEGTQNIFGQVFYNHFKVFKEGFKDLSNNDEAKRMAAMFLTLRDALDLALTAFEKLMVVIYTIFTLIQKYKEQLSNLIKIFLLIEGVRLVWTKMLLPLGLLYTQLVKIETISGLITKHWMLLPAIVIAGGIAMSAALRAISSGEESLSERLKKQQETAKEAAKLIQAKTSKEEFYKKLPDYDKIMSPRYLVMGTPDGTTYGDRFTKELKSQSDGLMQMTGDLTTKVFDLTIGKLFDKFTDIIPDIDLPALDAGKGLESLGKDAEELEKKLKDVMSIIGSMDTKFRELVERDISDMSVGMDEFKQHVKNAVEEAKADIDKYKKAIEYLNRADIVKQLEEKGYNKEQIQIKIDELNQQIKEAQKLIDSLNKDVVGRKDLFNIQNNYEQFTNKLKSMYSEGSAEYNKALKNYLEQLIPVINNLEFIDPKQMQDLKDYQRSLEETLRTSGNTFDGVKEGLREVANPSPFNDMKQAVTSAFDGMTEAVVNFTDTGKLNFADMISSFLKDLLRLELRMLVMKPMAEALSTYGGGAFGWLSSMFTGMANGGVITEPIIGRGLQTGTTYALGENTPYGENEIVAPASKLGGNVSVNIYGAPPGTQVKQSQDSQGNTNLAIILDNFMAKSAVSGGAFQQVMSSVYGLRPITVGR